MTPADQRILQLLQKWQTSLDLHARYAGLSEDQYWLVQPWPKHQRPTKWVIDLARQRVSDLSRIVQGRVAAGDPSLGEALELMSFLANLVGVQSVERFIPMAEPERERPLSSITMEMPVLPEATTAAPVPAPAPAIATPQPKPPTEPAAPRPAGTRPAGHSSRAQEQGRAQTHGQAHHKPRHGRSRGPAPVADGPRAQEVCNDAVRLLGWGREWHELPDAIARMADRPDASRVREILRTHRAEIERSLVGATSASTRTPPRLRPETQKH